MGSRSLEVRKCERWHARHATRILPKLYGQEDRWDLVLGTCRFPFVGSTLVVP
jgi:hypothetical protein